MSASAPQPDPVREIRLTGSLEAVHSYKVVVPQIPGIGGPLTLTRLIENGAKVAQGDVIAEFDPTQLLDNQRDAVSKYQDLTHQIEQKKAQNRSDDENRASNLAQAQAELDRAMLEVQKAPILSQIEKLENDVRAKIAQEHVESLKRSNAFHDEADAAALRILELQLQRQKVTVDRIERNIGRMQLKAPIAGMISHQVVYRGNSMGRAQEGDQLYRGQAVVSIFDPSEMQVRCLVGEPDGVILVPGTRASIDLDAYPDVSLPAHFEFASPVAASAIGSPIKTFTAVFRLDRTDPRLTPDLSAAVVIDSPGRIPQ